MRKKTQKEFDDEVYKLVGNEYIFLEPYVNSHTKILVKHNIEECGYIYPVFPYNFFGSHTRCPKCAKNLKRDTNQFKEEVDKISKGEYTVLGNYINNMTKLKIRHNICGYIYEVRPNDFITGYRCPYCAGNIKKTTEQFKKEIYDLVENEYESVGEYIDAKTKIKIKHNTCGYIYETRPNDFLSGYRCPNCFRNFVKTTNTFKKEVFNLVGNEYEVIGDYINSKAKILIKHNVCLTTYEVSPHHFLRGDRCPHCNESKGEKKILSVLKKIKINYIQQYKFNNCIYKKPLPFDKENSHTRCFSCELEF